MLDFFADRTREGLPKDTLVRSFHFAGLCSQKSADQLKNVAGSLYIRNRIQTSILSITTMDILVPLSGLVSGNLYANFTSLLAIKSY